MATTQNILLAAALAYAADGKAVFPCQPNGKLPLIKGGRGCLDASTDATLIRSWWEAHPRANVGIALGNGLLGIDVDTYKPGVDITAWDLPPTRMATTARGGQHLYFAYDGLLPNVPENVLGLGICIKATGGYFMAPPSRFQGNLYAWVDPYQPIARLPERIAVLIRDHRKDLPRIGPPSQPRPASTDDAGDHWLRKAMQKTSDGNGDTTGIWLAQQLLIAERNGQRVDPRSTLMTYAAQATRNPRDPFDERSVARWLRSAGESELVKRGEPARGTQPLQAARISPIRPQRVVMQANQPQTDGSSALALPDAAEEPLGDLTQFGLAKRLLAKHGPNVRFNKAFGFCVWTGTHWSIDNDLLVQSWAMEIVEQAFQDACAQRDKEPGEQADKRVKEAAARKTNATVEAMLKLIRPACLLETDAFDAQPWLFNCKNGTLELKNGKLRPHRREDYLTQMGGAPYSPSAQAPVLEKFAGEITCGRDELVAYAQRVFGYCLTGDTSEQVWHLMIGSGANGKSTLMEALAYVLGDYAGVLEPEAICTSGRPSDPAAASPHIAALKGKRFVRVTETEQGARLAVARIKRMVGGDAQSARFLHKNVFSYIPSFKLFIYSNHKPQARETGHAFWRRVRYFPFDWTAKKKDTQLIERLKAEAPGILAWLVRGCMEWQQNGLQPPQIVIDATAEYEHESDTLGLFLGECCVQGESYSIRARPLYIAYKEWCDQAGERVLAERLFGMAMVERGFKKAELRDANYWTGVGLRRGEE